MSTKSANLIPVSVKEDFLERLSKTSPVTALSELIWNGLDAGAEQIEVHITKGPLDGVDEICVRDSGAGISFSDVKQLFGGLGESWKKQAGRKNGRVLHGKNGQGRFKAFALGKHVTWDTTCAVNGSNLNYQIVGAYSSLRDFRLTEPKSKHAPTGTSVWIKEIDKAHLQLTSGELPQELAKVFAVYMSQYPTVRIIVNGTPVDPLAMQSCKKDIALAPVTLEDGTNVEVSVSIIEWQTSTKRTLHLCDEDGVSLHEMETGVQAPGFNFTAYLKSGHLRELDKTNDLIMGDSNRDVKTILSAGKEAIRTYFRGRAASKKQKIVERWKVEKVYPYEEKEGLSLVEEAERQVFDILGVNLEAYLPKFEEADQGARRFTFRLLAQALHENPRSVQQIITEVLNLKKEEQDDLAELLNQTALSNIISTAKVVANRLNFLVALENLLFDDATKKKLLERDQLHKILESEAWIFDEEFALAGSEKRLEEVLQLHLSVLGKREDDLAPVLREGNKQGRVDLMLSRANRPRHDEYDYLVVELKRPSQNITSTILNQIESYAIAVAKDPRFHTKNTRWRFIVVSNEMDEHARRKATQRERKKGLVFDDSELNFQVWAFDWTEIISNARARLQFINAALEYEADRDSAKDYLNKTHNKYVPETDTATADVDEEDTVE